MNNLVTAGVVVVGVGLVAWLLRRGSGTEEVDRSLLAGRTPGPPPDVSVAEPEDEPESGGIEELMEPGRMLAISSDGEVFLPYGGQVHVLPLGDARDRGAGGVTSWDRVKREVIDAQRMAEGTGQSVTQLSAGDFTGGRVKRGAPGVDPWRLELLGREGEYLVYAFETEEAARVAFAMLEENEIIRRPVGEDGEPVPPSAEDFEEARRLYQETLTELSAAPEEPEQDPPGGGAGGTRASSAEDALAARTDEAPRAEAEPTLGVAVAAESGAIAEAEAPPAAPEEPIRAGQLAAETETASDLPSPEAQEWLVAQLADLIRRASPEPFLCAPLVLPNDSFFPDRWQGDAASVQRLLDRLLGYARVERGAVAQLRVPPELLARPDVLVALAARAAAAAWRRTHRLAAPPSRLEQALTDLTMLYLGFGILVVNADRAVDRSRVEGSLSSQALCFLLALQAVVCDIPHGRYGRWLDPTRAAFFGAAIRELEPRLDELIERLGLPPEEEWPESWESSAGRS